MSRISQTFRRLKKQGRKALIPFITAGDPNLKATEALVFTLEKAGADIIELGIPFSDPMADGPVIQASSERALAKGVTLAKVLGLVRKLRRKTQIPLLLMGYYNPVFVMGHEVFAKKARQAGVDAVLLVDLPPEECRPLRKELRKQGIYWIPLLAPTSDAQRIQKVLRVASGFIYYVSMTGVTGASLKPTQSLSAHLHEIYTKTKLPVVVGFGITSPEQARALAKVSHGIVVGSAIVRLFAPKGSLPSLQKKVYPFIHSLRQSIDT